MQFSYPYERNIRSCFSSVPPDLECSTNTALSPTYPSSPDPIAIPLPLSPSSASNHNVNLPDSEPQQPQQPQHVCHYLSPFSFLCHVSRMACRLTLTCSVPVSCPTRLQMMPMPPSNTVCKSTTIRRIVLSYTAFGPDQTTTLQRLTRGGPISTMS